MLEDNVLERDELVLEYVESPRFVPASYEPGTQSDKQDFVARALSPQENPAARPPASPVQVEAARPQATAKERRNSFLHRHPVVSAIGAMLLASAIAGGYLYMDYARHYETTDDAFIAARQLALAPKVAGYITAVAVTDNEHVAAGQVIARIDDRDYRIALAQAEAQVAAAEASIENIDAQIAVQRAQVAQAEAQVQQLQAGLTYAEQQSARYGKLARDGWGSAENAQQWASQQRQSEASLQAAKQALVAAGRQLDVLKAQRSTAEANLAQATAQRDQAKLNLSYTTVVAAQPGRVVQLGAAVGQYAQVGAALAMFVPDDIWVAANFKEIQLAGMQPGQAVTLRIDAYPEYALHGHVASVQPGSGTAFSLLPPENATGNYVKIVQRVPVKIVLDDPPTDVALGPGMSVAPSVRVDPSPSLAERLESIL
jgi:membrane fusion protein (multidrug efflux system)